MDEQPFYEGDVLRCTNSDMIGASWPVEGQEYTCTGCRMGSDGHWYVGVKGLDNGGKAWYPWRFELAYPETKAYDSDTYQTEEP